MNIININSEIEITHSQKTFIEEVLSCGDAHPCDPMKKENSFLYLSKTVPIFLINEKSMPDVYNQKQDNHNQDQDKKPQTEWLGFYTRESCGLFKNTPIIAICPERIESCVKGDKEEFLFLLAKVIVHEFAHAKMDFGDENKNCEKDKFFQWMEESMANQLTLEVFCIFTKGCHRHNPYKLKSWKNNLFEFVVDFITKQPPEYDLGYKIFNKEIGMWEEWRKYKGNSCNKVKEKKIENWLKYVIDYETLGEKITKNLYTELLDCDFEKKARKRITRTSNLKDILI